MLILRLKNVFSPDRKFRCSKQWSVWIWYFSYQKSICPVSSWNKFIEFIVSFPIVVSHEYATEIWCCHYVLMFSYLIFSQKIIFIKKINDSWKLELLFSELLKVKSMFPEGIYQNWLCNSNFTHRSFSQHRHDSTIFS